MQKNQSGQKLEVIAFDSSGRVSGDASNITCTLAIDDGTRSAVADTNPTEISSTGVYLFDLAQAETNGYKLSFIPASASSGVQVLAQPSNVIYTESATSSTSGTTSSKNVVREVGQTDPIYFTFPTPSLVDGDFTKTMVIDDGTSEAVNGTITYKYEFGGLYWYKLAYDADDRPADTGFVRFSLTDGTSTVTFGLSVLTSLATIDTAIDGISTSITTGALVYTPLPNAYDIVIVAGDAYDDVANDIIDVPVTGDYTGVDIEFVVRETDDTILLSHDSTGVTLTGGDGTVALTMSSVSTRLDPGDYQYGIEAAYSATSKKTLRSGTFSIRKDYAREA